MGNVDFVLYNTELLVYLPCCQMSHIQFVVLLHLRIWQKIENILKIRQKLENSVSSITHSYA